MSRTQETITLPATLVTMSAKPGDSETELATTTPPAASCGVPPEVSRCMRISPPDPG